MKTLGKALKSNHCGDQSRSVGGWPWAAVGFGWAPHQKEPRLSGTDWPEKAALQKPHTCEKQKDMGVNSNRFRVWEAEEREKMCGQWSEGRS